MFYTSASKYLYIISVKLQVVSLRYLSKFSEKLVAKYIMLELGIW